MTAFRIDPSEPLGREIARNACKQFYAAIACLEGVSADPARALHETRKSLKKLRALLILVRKAAPKRMKAEERRVREAARAIAGPREASALIETVDRFAREFPDKAAACGLHALRSELEARLARIEADGAHIEEAVAIVLAACREGRKSLLAFTPESKSCDATILAKGVKKMLRRWRRALKAAKTRREPEDFHDLRKAVKAHWAHLGLLRDIWPGGRRKRREAADALGEHLGELNDIHVMRAALHSGALGLPAAIETEGFDKLLKAKSRSLSKLCLAEAERLLDGTPKKLRKHFKDALHPA